MKILISGAGIAGPTLAYWLHRYGFQPTLVEKSPRLRTGGYIIDFWGLGFEIAEKMGLRPKLEQLGYRVKEVRIVNEHGQKKGGFSADAFRRLTQGRYVSIPRGELAAALFEQLGPNVETVFGDEISLIDDSRDGARVTFAGGRTERFDLVIGADGLHSQVRRLAFGDERQFEKYLGYKVAAFEAEGYQPRDEDVYLMHLQVGQQLARFSMRNEKTMFLFVFAEKSAQHPRDLAEQKRWLQERFQGSGWESKAILDFLASAKELYFDRVSQIRMREWSRGRVALVGDAAYCVSLLAGQGSALAMTGAYALAGELHRAKGDYQTAFQRYQETLAPFLLKKQKAAEGFGGFFAPKSELSLFLHNQATKLLSVPGVAELTIGRDLQDRIKLPDYESS
jgi:2-polyprenyl-6-methoxyphenol hydroxylase-like FAD-dependent oxidoreductase